MHMIADAAKRGLMTFWYFYSRKLNAMWPSITLQGKRIDVLPDVYKPLENEQACASYCKEGERVLDLGCGSGVGTIFCAPKAREVVAVDISDSAVANTLHNCRLHGLTNVTVAKSDMFENVSGKFDLILANPPYIAVAFERENEQYTTSVRYLPALFASVKDHLADDGRLLIQFPLWFRGRIHRLAAQHGMKVVSVDRMPAKSPGLLLTSLLYLQVGFLSTYYLLEREPAGRVADPSTADRLPAAA